jgi:hypothetical protein
MAPRLSSGLLVIFYAGMRKTFPLTTDCGVAAGLNYGDCFAYALAKAINEPLLFKGEDFGKTDVTPALSTSSGTR